MRPLRSARFLGTTLTLAGLSPPGCAALEFQKNQRVSHFTSAVSGWAFLRIHPDCLAERVTYPIAAYSVIPASAACLFASSLLILYIFLMPSDTDGF